MQVIYWKNAAHEIGLLKEILYEAIFQPDINNL